MERHGYERTEQKGMDVGKSSLKLLMLLLCLLQRNKWSHFKFVVTARSTSLGSPFIPELSCSFM